MQLIRCGSRLQDCRVHLPSRRNSVLAIWTRRSLLTRGVRSRVARPTDESQNRGIGEKGRSACVFLSFDIDL